MGVDERGSVQLGQTVRSLAGWMDDGLIGREECAGLSAEVLVWSCSLRLAAAPLASRAPLHDGIADAAVRVVCRGCLSAAARSL